MIDFILFSQDKSKLNEYFEYIFLATYLELGSGIFILKTVGIDTFWLQILFGLRVL